MTLKHVLLKILLVLWLIVVTPFALLLSLMPGYDGPLDWFRYCAFLILT